MEAATQPQPDAPAPTPLTSREADLRRPDFRGGVPVLMADGQEWFLPQPALMVAATDDGFTLTSDLGGEFDASVNRMQDAGTDYELFKAFCDLARHMLAINYDLPPGLVTRIVRVSRKDFVRDDIVAAVTAIAQGFDAPKPGAAGSA